VLPIGHVVRGAVLETRGENGLRVAGAVPEDDPTPGTLLVQLAGVLLAAGHEEIDRLERRFRGLVTWILHRLPSLLEAVESFLGRPVSAISSVSSSAGLDESPSTSCRDGGLPRCQTTLGVTLSTRA
jgi:hypothetical protein